MTNLTPPPSPSEGIEEAKARARQLANAFHDVFGQEGKRTANQRMVMEHLTKCVGEGENSFRFGEARDGIAIIGAGIHRDGAQSLLRIISRQLALAAKAVDEPQKAKPKTKR